MSIQEFINKIPKAELHVHIEGTFEPELMFEIAKRNNLLIPFNSVEEIKQAYRFNNLQEFLDIYYAGASVLRKEQDFYDLTWAYLLKAKEQNIIHTEIFFDPQTHTERGISFDIVINGIYNALINGEKELGISFKLIMCFLRHLDEASAFKTLSEALPFKEWIDGIGLDSTEIGNPPVKFENVFAKARENNFLFTSHAGEEGPSSYIWGALNDLQVNRIDHGNRCLDDENLVKHLVERQIPLTLCPLSNKELKVVKEMKDYPLMKMLDKGLLATVNSDDPAYFGGYINENYLAVAQAHNLSKMQISQLAKNSFKASWLGEEEKARMNLKLEEYLRNGKILF